LMNVVTGPPIQICDQGLFWADLWLRSELLLEHLRGNEIVGMR
jgi:hypothetical protein